MRILPLFLLLVSPLIVVGQSEGEILRIKIEWVNAEACGIDGCKPQALVLRSGSSMTFGWPEIPDRGIFEIRPLLEGNRVTFAIIRMKMTPGKDPGTVASKDVSCRLGEAETVTLNELEWEVTATTVEP